MSPTNPTQVTTVLSADWAEHALRAITNVQPEWFMMIDGRTPVNVTSDAFEFSASYGRLIFSCWTEAGARTWRVSSWRWSGEKLELKVTRRMGAEVATFELVPRASAKAIVASIAASRQERCERLAQLVAQTLAGVGGWETDQSVEAWGLGVEKNEGVGGRVLGVEKEGHPKPNT